ncbi:MAG TPA: hypothetical protein VN618_13010 [Solirubrobacteraceae bacterium]|nr:hypothetical protein [Solirubrobacteraceae bacterium]
MNGPKRLAVALAGGLAALALAAAPAGALGDHHPPHQAAPVFVQTDGLASNQIAVYDRGPGGILSPAGLYPTGGLGGALEGSVVDHLASQGSLLLDREQGLLLAVNAGSGTVSVFAVFGDRLLLRQTISSGGAFPVSLAERDGLVYVLNAEQGGSVQGFRLFAGRLFPIPNSGRPLSLDPSAVPQFVNTPGQVAFSPDGRQLIVTTKANGSAVDVFGVGPLGRLSGAPVVNPLPGAVPFAVDFDRYAHLLVTEAGANSLASFALRFDGHIVALASAPTEQAATCWIAAAGGRFYTSNAGSASLTGFQEGPGALTLSAVSRTATDAGTVDAAVPSDERNLYVQAGGQGLVDEYAVTPAGLTEIGSVTVPGAVGGEGIVAP